MKNDRNTTSALCRWAIITDLLSFKASPQVPPPPPPLARTYSQDLSQSPLHCGLPSHRQIRLHSGRQLGGKPQHQSAAPCQPLRVRWGGMAVRRDVTGIYLIVGMPSRAKEGNAVERLERLSYVVGSGTLREWYAHDHRGAENHASWAGEEDHRATATLLLVFNSISSLGKAAHLTSANRVVGMQTNSSSWRRVRLQQGLTALQSPPLAARVITCDPRRRHTRSRPMVRIDYIDRIAARSERTRSSFRTANAWMSARPRQTVHRR